MLLTENLNHCGSSSVEKGHGYVAPFFPVFPEVKGIAEQVHTWAVTASVRVVR